LGRCTDCGTAMSLAVLELTPWVIRCPSCNAEYVRTLESRRQTLSL
jgi:hypothetical protein